MLTCSVIYRDIRAHLVYKLFYSMANPGRVSYDTHHMSLDTHHTYLTPTMRQLTPTLSKKCWIFKKKSMGKTSRGCIDLGSVFIFQKYWHLPGVTWHLPSVTWHPPMTPRVGVKWGLVGVMWRLVGVKVHLPLMWHSPRICHTAIYNS